jgi:hypothetical protein
MQAIGSPQPASVIAIGLGNRQTGMSAPRASREIFATQIGGALVQSCHIQSVPTADGELALSIIVPETTQILSLLRRIDSLRDEFERNLPELITRLVVHHGIVFPTAQGHMGAVLRAAQARLQSLPKLPGEVDTVATGNFVAYTRTWPAHDLHFESESCGEQYDLYAFSLASATPEASPESAPDDWVSYLTVRLAEHLGPFAQVLVDSACRSSKTPEHLAREVASEIDDTSARERFLNDALAYLRQHRKPD